MGKIFCLSNQKGGVAKTYSTWAISNELVQLGYSVLVVDGDGQNTLSHDFGIESLPDKSKSLAALLDKEIISEEYDTKDAIIHTEHGVDLIPASIDQISMGDSVLRLNNAIDGTFAVRTIVSQIKDDYDFIFIDCPPTLDRLTINMMTASDEVIIPVNATRESTEGLEQLLRTINKVQKSLNESLAINGIIFTNLNQRESLRQAFMKQTLDVYKKYLYLYEAKVPRSAKAEQAVAMRKPLHIYCNGNPTHVGYKMLVEEFLQREKEDA